MKKVIYWLCFVLALFLPTSNQAKELNPAPHIKVSQADVTLHNYQSNCDAILFNDLVEDESDDDLPASERKKSSSGKLQIDNTLFFAGNYPGNHFKKVLNAGSFFTYRTTRYIYFSVFRL